MIPSIQHTQCRGTIRAIKLDLDCLDSIVNSAECKEDDAAAIKKDLEVVQQMLLGISDKIEKLTER